MKITNNVFVPERSTQEKHVQLKRLLDYSLSNEEIEAILDVRFLVSTRRRAP